MKDKVINDLLSKISDLEFEVERLNNIINELEKYINGKNKIKVETDGYIWQLIRPSITCKDLKK